MPSAAVARFLALVVALTLGSAGTLPAQGPASNSVVGAGAKVEGRYAQANGVRLYYELHGASRPGRPPLVLLHGALQAGIAFGPTITALAAGRQVILVDLQGHGHTADVDRPMTFEAMGDDIAALLGTLGVRQADVMGYSMGAVVAMQTAIRHPELVRRLVVVSGAMRSDAFYPDMIAARSQVNASLAESMKPTPVYQLYASVAPRPQDFPRLLDKVGEMMRRPFDYSAQLARLESPTLLVGGDADMIPPAHFVEMFALLDGGKRDGGWDGAGRSKRAQLAMLPGLTHYTISDAPALTATVIPFLDAETAR